MASDLHDLEHALQTYFDGLYEGDVNKLGRVFHDCAHLFSNDEGVATEHDRDMMMPAHKGTALEVI